MEWKRKKRRRTKTPNRTTEKDLNEMCIVMHVALGDIIENQDKWYTKGKSMEHSISLKFTLSFSLSLSDTYTLIHISIYIHNAMLSAANWYFLYLFALCSYTMPQPRSHRHAFNIHFISFGEYSIIHWKCLLRSMSAHQPLYSTSISECFSCQNEIKKTDDKMKINWKYLFSLFLK